MDLNAALAMTTAMGVLVAGEPVRFPVPFEVDGPDGRIEGFVHYPWMDDQETLRVHVVYRPPLDLASIQVHFEVVT